MLTKEEIIKYATEEFSKMSYFEMLDAYINECYQHEITKNTLELTLDKLETSRRAVKRLKERSKNKMKIEDILTNLEITCSQNNINIQDVVLLYIMERLCIIDYDNLQQNINKFRLDLQEEHDLLWDLQPTIEDDEDHAFVVQRARDIYNILVGRELC